MRVDVASALLLGMCLVVSGCESGSALATSAGGAAGASGHGGEDAVGGAATNGTGTAGANAGAGGASSSGAGTGASGAGTPWQSEGDILLQTSSVVETVTADPVVPRHLILVLQNNSELATEWTNGALGHPLISGTGSLDPYSQGAGLDGDGNAYLYWSGVSQDPMTPFSLARRKSGGDYAWADLPLVEFVSPAPPDWPPTSLVVDPQSPGRVFLHRSEDWMMDVTTAIDHGFDGATIYLAEDATATPPLGSFAGLVFSRATRGDFMVRTTTSVRRCHLTASIVCDAPAPDLFASDASASIALSRGEIVYVAVNGTKIQRSGDGGSTFAAISVPHPERPFTKVVASGSADVVAVYYGYATADDGSNIPEDLRVTTDAGAHWSQLTLPSTPSIDFDDMTFDAAGTLFLVRGSRLFSLATF